MVNVYAYSDSAEMKRESNFKFKAVGQEMKIDGLEKQLENLKL